MTRTYTEKPVWTWRCDECGHEERIAREQSLLPTPAEMRKVGWFIADKWGDLCPECVMLTDRKPKDRPIVEVHTNKKGTTMTDTITPLEGYSTDVTRYSEETLFKVQKALQSIGLEPKTITSAISAMQNEGILFREPILDEREHLTDGTPCWCNPTVEHVPAKGKARR